VDTAADGGGGVAGVPGGRVSSAGRRRRGGQEGRGRHGGAGAAWGEPRRAPCPWRPAVRLLPALSAVVTPRQRPYPV